MIFRNTHQDIKYINDLTLNKSMEAKNKEKKNPINYYKISTFVLLGILVLFGINYGINSYGSSKFNQGVLTGQQSTFGTLLNELSSKGYVSIQGDNLSVVLVPSNSIQVAQEQTIMTIIDTVEKNGYVSISNNNSEVILVPYQQPEE